MAMSLEQARKFLAKVIPWDGETYAGIHWTFVPSDHEAGRKPIWGGRAARNLDDAVGAVAYALRGKNTRDIYVCLSTQSAADPRVSANGFKYLSPIRNQENAVALKCLFLDIDFKGGDTGYDDEGAALTALGNFIKATGLPRPSVTLYSGGGMHVYWSMARALTPDEWRPLAFALANATKQLDFKCDRQVTIDSARVLRVPDTFNCKLETRRSVRLAGRMQDFDYAVERIEQALEPYKVVVPVAQASALIDPALFPRRAAIQGDSLLGAGIETAMPQSEVIACLAAIPNTTVDWNAWNTIGMRVYAACNGADYGLAEWEAWSQQNVAASAEGKDSCADRWRTFHSSPPTRTGAGALVNEARLATGDPKWTPHGAVTPGVTTQLGLAPPPGSALPKGYSRDPNGIILRISINEDGTANQIPICQYAIDEGWLQGEPELLHFMTKIRGRDKKISVPLEIVGTQEMRKYLQGQGFMLPVGGKGAENVSEFLLAWIKKLQETTDSARSAPFGWNVQNSRLAGFIYGGQQWSPTGTTPAAMADHVLARHYKPEGEIQPWIDAAKMITDQGRPELEALVASSFAAPLVRFTGLPGVLMSAYSQASGIGKSTALKVAQAVWGDPIRSVQSLGDTQNATMHKLGEIRSLPLYWDELKTEDDTKKFVNVTFQTTQGKERSRLSRNITQREPGSWQTLLVSASNDSLLDYVLGQTNMTTAGLYRIFEYAMAQPKPGSQGQIDTSEASRMVAKLHDHYGAVGLKYAEFLGTNHVKIEADVADYLKVIGQEVKSLPDERFWIALIAVVLMGARYANQLGVAEFDEGALKAFMLGVLAKMRQVRIEQPVDMTKDINISNLFAQFISAMKGRHTLYTNRIPVGRGKPPKGTFKIIGDVSRLDGVYVHVGTEDKMMRISSLALGDWLKEKGYSRHMVMTALEAQFGLQRINGRIGAGTGDMRVTGATEHLLQVDLCGTPLLDFLDGI